MIVITGTAKLVEGAREAMTAATVTMVAATREEPGNHGITYSFDISDPDTMVFHEMYEDMAAMQAHMGSPHMGAFYAAGGDLMAGRPSVQMWVNAEEGQMGPG